ncbi:quinon protein alcohol dehydrogenase-like superfamily [Aspergillus egyptiacus]|nr:quinon protein alcohol dehydrogenase-like superfamily [Aspergillus egyptiacus]
MRNMQRCLRPDLCGLVIPGCIPDGLKQAEIAEKIQFETSYACRSWVYHIQKAGLEADIVYRFIKSRVLQWLEALAWLQELYTGIYMVQSLREMRNLQGHSQLRCALYDLYRYLMQHRSIIEKAPLQIYHCLVSFGPERSFMRKIFSNLTRCAVLRTGSLPVAWSPCVQTWENVARISVSPSMDMVACVTVSGTLELRKTMTGRCMNVLNHTLFGSSTPIDCLVFSANGSMLLTAVRNRAQIWSTKLGMLIHDLHGRCDPVSHAVFGNDDKLVATMSRRGKVIELWDTCGGALTKTLEGHTDGILCVDFSKDGRCIVSSSLDKTIRVWDWRNGTTLHELKGHTGEIDTISFTSAGDQVLSYSTEDGTLRLWDAAKGTFHYVHKTSSVTAVAILRDHGIIAYAAVDYAIALWNLNTKILIRTFGDHSRRVFSLCFSANGRRLASKSSDHTIRVWDVKTGNCIQTLDSFGFPNMEFLTEDGDRIIYSDIEECGIWECGGDAATEAKSPNCSQIVTLAHSPDSNVLLSGAKNGTLAIWDMRTGSCMHAPGDLDGDIVTKAVLSSDGSKAACLTNGGELRLLDTNSRNWVHIFKCWIEEVQFCFSPSVTYFAYVTNSRLYIRRVETGELVLETDLLVRGPRIHFSPHSDVIIVMSDDGTAQLCTLPSMVAGLESLDGCMTWLRGLGLSIVNDLPINQSESAIRFWDIHTKRSRSMLRKRSGLRQLRCSGDGKVIVAMYSDGQVQVWSPETEDCAYVRHQPLDSSVLMVSASGETAVALSSGTEMTLWNPTTGKSHSIYTDETVVVRP